MSPARTVLVVQHAAWEEPGIIARALDSRGLTWRAVTALDDPNPDLPDVAELDGLVVMGGPMGALDDAAHPGLAAERRLLAEATAAGVPVLGVCLGMQLLAVALGARLHTGRGSEVGMAPVALTGAGLRDPMLYPLTVDATPDPVVLHWHGDAVDAPAGSTVLASSDVTPVQAFRHGSALGLQFHLEVDGPLLARWLAEPVMSGDLSAGAVAQIAADAAARFPSLVPRAHVVFGAFADAILSRRG
ncbi:GMP synthase (glutamine-hydrolysing) [Sanguibacter gelidistatuariae]|uniref:GMP synthase (Glutamine-hydrolysing) n=1 Tax=Sanguibacter gelidistatuariae TaxID=1814289 RepID=A0A1G6RJB6_9MICO|nr:type 1 glutamine amidotransferase [Sanguibacter gelidistatuariae]SDD04740.1 GMP synthase (glutamine-hydrolysing) [Sanguibacter gelidistatuariae]